MKRQIQESGERKWYGNDHIIMQNELWTAIESFFEPYGCAILKGCKINVDNDQWTIAAGIVGLYAPDKSEYRVCKLQETSLPVSTPVAYLSLQSREETEEYLTGGVKPILKEYYAEVSTVVPGYGEYLAIKKEGDNVNFRKAFQDATARMVTDAQIQNWNGKEPAIDKKTGFNLDKSDSTNSTRSDTLASSKAVSTAKSEVISEVQGGILSSYNTLLKLYNWVVTQLGLKAPTNHASTGMGYGVADASNYGHTKLNDSTDGTSDVSSGISATPKAVSTSKSEAIATVLGGVSSAYNTLKKLYDWTVSQLSGKVSKSGDVMTGLLVNTALNGTTGACISGSSLSGDALFGVSDTTLKTPTDYIRVGVSGLQYTKNAVGGEIYNSHHNQLSDSTVSASSTNIATSKAVKSVQDLISGVQIYSGTNLNTITAPGNYFCPSNDAVATLINCPTSKAFSLEVKKDAGVVQILRAYYETDERHWYRNLYGSSWRNWNNMVTRLTDAIGSTSNASGVYAATPLAVKTVADRVTVLENSNSSVVEMITSQLSARVITLDSTIWGKTRTWTNDGNGFLTINIPISIFNSAAIGSYFKLVNRTGITITIDLESTGNLALVENGNLNNRNEQGIVGIIGTDNGFSTFEFIKTGTSSAYRGIFV